MACGGFHTAVLSNAGELFTFGSSEEYQLGHGDDEDQEEPVMVTPDSGNMLGAEHIVSVECGPSCTAVVTLSGQVYEWGNCRGHLIEEPTPLGAAFGDVTPPAELSDRLAISCGLGDQHCAVLAVGEPGAYHRKPHGRCWRLGCILPSVPATIVRTGELYMPYLLRAISMSTYPHSF